MMCESSCLPRIASVLPMICESSCLPRIVSVLPMHNISLTPPLFIPVPLPSQESERSYVF
jgi:hypothetical protein